MLIEGRALARVGIMKIHYEKNVQSHNYPHCHTKIR